MTSNFKSKRAEVGSVLINAFFLLFSFFILSHSKIQQTKILVTCQRFGDLFLFGLVWQYSSIQKNIIKVGSKSWILTCSCYITLSLPFYTYPASKRELNFCNGYLSLLYFWCPISLSFWRPLRDPLDLGTPMGHPMGLWFEILKDCWPCMCFQCRSLWRSDTQHALYLRLFGDLSGGPWTRDAHGSPHGHQIQNFKVVHLFFHEIH